MSMIRWRGSEMIGQTDRQVNVSCIKAANPNFNSNMQLTAGGQDVLRSRRHGLDTGLTQAVLPVKCHSVPSGERSPGSTVVSKISQQGMSCNPMVRVSVYQLWPFDAALGDWTWWCDVTWHWDSGGHLDRCDMQHGARPARSRPERLASALFVHHE